MHGWNIYPTLYVSFSNIQLNNKMMKFSNVYVSITGYLLQQINIHQCKEKSQHYMLAHPDFNKISTDTYKQEIFLTFMLSGVTYITCPLNPVKVEVIANIQCFLPTRKVLLHKKSFPRNITNIYVIIFGNAQYIWHLIHRWNI